MHSFSKQVEAIIKLAKESAKQSGQAYVGTEHLLMALTQEGTNLAAQALLELGVTEYRLQAEIDEQLKSRMQETWVMGRLPGTPHYRDVLCMAAREARGTGNWQTGPEHILLALLAEPACVGCKTLVAMGINAEQVRQTIIRCRAAAKSPQQVPQTILSR